MTKPTKKTMVLARSGLSDVPSDEQIRVQSAVRRVPSARVKADLGSIIQISLDPERETQLRSEVEKLAGWQIDNESSASMPVDRAPAPPRNPMSKAPVRTTKPKATKKGKVGMRPTAKKARKTTSKRGKAQR